MPEALYTQNTFPSGVLHGGGASLFDIQQYTQALAKAENISIDPLGKIRVRSGLREIDDIGPDANFSSINYFSVDINSSGELYINVFYDVFRYYFYSLTHNRGNRYQGFSQWLGVFGDFFFYHSNGVSGGGVGLTRRAYKIGDVDSAKLQFKQIVRYTQKVENIDTDYTWETTGAPFTEREVSAIYFYNDRMMFAVGDRIYASDVGQYLTGTNQDTITFTRSARVGEVVQHNDTDLTITIADVGDSIATDSLETRLTGRQNNDVFNMQDNEGLFAFTRGGVYFTSEQILEPGKFVLRPVTDTPMKPIAPVEVQNNFMFVRASTGAPEAVIDLKQEVSTEAIGFNEDDVSVFVNGLIKDVKRLVVSKGTDKDTQEIVFALEQDGLTCHALHVNRTQKIFAWTQYKFKTPMLDIAAYENRVFFIDNTKLYELNGDNSDVEWEVETLRPSISQRGEQINLTTTGWRIVRAYLEARNIDINTPIFINNKELALRRFDDDGTTRTGNYDISIQGVNSRANTATDGLASGIKISGTGGGDVIIDSIAVLVSW